MPQALITVNGVPGSNLDVPINTLINLSNQNTGGETTYDWTILSQPPGAADSLSSTTIQSPTLTPTKEGTYLLRIVVNAATDNLSNQVVVSVRHLKTRTRVPAAFEEAEAGAQGWSDPNGADDVLRLAQERTTDPGVAVVAAGEVLAVGAVVRFAGTTIIKSGLPGEETLPSAFLAEAATATEVDGPLGYVVSSVDGGGIAIGTLINIRQFGIVDGIDLGSPAVGDRVYVSDTGTLSLAPGANERIVGEVIANGAGATDAIYFSGFNAESQGVSGGTLQAAYTAGNTIAVTAGNGTVSVSNAADVTDLVTLSRTFAGAGNALDVTMGAGTTDPAISIVTGNTATTSRGIFIDVAAAATDGVRVENNTAGNRVSLSEFGLLGEGDGADFNVGTALVTVTGDPARAFTLLGGQGGPGDGGTAGGAGATVTIRGGVGGLDGGAGAGAGGSLVLDAGSSTGTNGSITIGVSSAASITSGSGSTIWQHDGQISISNGSFAAPALRFTNDIDTGIAFVANFFTIVTGAAARIQVGSTSATFLVDVVPSGTRDLGSTSAGWDQLFLNNGSASDPSIAFASDPDTGMYSPGTGQVALVTGGTARFDQTGSSEHQTRVLGGMTTEGTIGDSALNLTNANDLTGSSGVQVLCSITGTINQSGTAGYTMLFINATETAAGSGDKVAILAQIAGTNRFRLTDTECDVRITGSAANPALEIDNDSKGLYSPASSELGFTASADAFIWDAAGGTTSLRPDTDNVYVLGEAALRWANIYVATTTVGDIRMHLPDKGPDSPFLILREGHAELVVYDVQARKRYRVPLEEVPLEEGDEELMQAAWDDQYNEEN